MKAENRRYELTIEQDSCAEDPREWNWLGRMVCWHRRYNLGDEQPSLPAHEWLKELARTFTNYEELPCDSKRFNELENISFENAMAIVEKHCIILPLYLYDHSGITMNTTGFYCPWDSGQIGWIYVTKDKLRKEYGKRWRTLMIRQLLRDEVKVYDEFLRGDVYYFSLTDKKTGETDSCGGFYGDDWKHNGILEHLPKGAHKLLEALE